MLNCCSECPDVFVTDEEMNDGEDTELLFIPFCYYESVRYCSLHNQIYTENDKIFPLFMRLDFFIKERLQHIKVVYLNIE